MKQKPFFLIFLFCLLAIMGFAQHSKHRSSFSRSPRVRSHELAKHYHGSSKTVHVRAYTKKNGTHVSAYDRRPPGH